MKVRKFANLQVCYFILATCSQSSVNDLKKCTHVENIKNCPFVTFEDILKKINVVYIGFILKSDEITIKNFRKLYFTMPTWK